MPLDDYTAMVANDMTFQSSSVKSETTTSSSSTNEGTSVDLMNSKNGHAEDANKKVKKTKVARRACLKCREKKMKCDGDPGDGSAPKTCSHCLMSGDVCEFVPSKRGGKRKKKVTIATDEDPLKKQKVDSIEVSNGNPILTVNHNMNEQAAPQLESLYQMPNRGPPSTLESASFESLNFPPLNNMLNSHTETPPFPISEMETQSQKTASTPFSSQSQNPMTYLDSPLLAMSSQAEFSKILQNSQTILSSNSNIPNTASQGTANRQNSYVQYPSVPYQTNSFASQMDQTGATNQPQGGYQPTPPYINSNNVPPTMALQTSAAPPGHSGSQMHPPPSSYTHPPYMHPAHMYPPPPPPHPYYPRSPHSPMHSYHRCPPHHRGRPRHMCDHGPPHRRHHRRNSPSRRFALHGPPPFFWHRGLPAQLRAHYQNAVEESAFSDVTTNDLHKSQYQIENGLNGCNKNNSFEASENYRNQESSNNRDQFNVTNGGENNGFNTTLNDVNVISNQTENMRLASEHGSDSNRKSGKFSSINDLCAVRQNIVYVPATSANSFYSHSLLWNTKSEIQYELYRVSDSLLRMYDLPEWDILVNIIQLFYTYRYPYHLYFPPLDKFMKDLNVPTQASFIHMMILHTLPFFSDKIYPESMIQKSFCLEGKEGNKNDATDLNGLSADIFATAKKHWHNMSEITALQAMLLVLLSWMQNVTCSSTHDSTSFLQGNISAFFEDSIKFLKVARIHVYGLKGQFEGWTKSATSQMMWEVYSLLNGLWGFKNMISAHNWVTLKINTQFSDENEYEAALNKLESSINFADYFLSPDWVLPLSAACVQQTIESGKSPNNETVVHTPIKLNEIFQLDENDPSLKDRMFGSIYPECYSAFLCCLLDNMVYGKPYERKLEYLNLLANKNLLSVQEDFIEINSSCLSAKSTIIMMLFIKSFETNDLLLRFMAILELLELIKLPNQNSQKLIKLEPTCISLPLNWLQYPQTAKCMGSKFLNYLNSDEAKVHNITLIDQDKTIEVNGVSYDLTQVNTKKFLFFDNWQDFVEKVRFLNTNLSMIEKFVEVVKDKY